MPGKLANSFWDFPGSRALTSRGSGHLETITSGPPAILLCPIEPIPSLPCNVKQAMPAMPPYGVPLSIRHVSMLVPSDVTLVRTLVRAVKNVANFVTSSDCALAAKMMSLSCSCTCCARSNRTDRRSSLNERPAQSARPSSSNQPQVFQRAHAVRADRGRPNPDRPASQATRRRCYPFRERHTPSGRTVASGEHLKRLCVGSKDNVFVVHLHLSRQEVTSRVYKTYRIDDRHGRSVHFRAIDPEPLGEFARFAPIKENRTRISLQVKQPSGGGYPFRERYHAKRTKAD